MSKSTVMTLPVILLLLDWNRQREICRVIFDESLKRAFLFPRQFGADFLNVLVPKGTLQRRSVRFCCFASATSSALLSSLAQSRPRRRSLAREGSST